jgi:hypothetical protein
MAWLSDPPLSPQELPIRLSPQRTKPPFLRFQEYCKSSAAVTETLRKPMSRVPGASPSEIPESKCRNKQGCLILFYNKLFKHVVASSLLLTAKLILQPLACIDHYSTIGIV